MIAIIIKIAPMPVITVKDSPRKIVEIIMDTIISFKRITVEVIGDIFLNPLDQIKYGMFQQKIAVYMIELQASQGKARKLFAKKGTTGINGIIVKNKSQLKDIAKFLVSLTNGLL